ncbi:MAG TPA: hypothetical protein VKQ70_10435 [Caulobacteraceae bacterium]|nr:hypothetical protein [Caulobacteraceae bacterium]
MSRWVCKLCIIQKGLKGSDLERWPENPTDMWIIDHMRAAHGIEVAGATAVVTGAVGQWVPFEERPRPDADLVGARLVYDGMAGTVLIEHPDEGAIGRINAWLMGQMMLARTEIEDT